MKIEELDPQLQAGAAKFPSFTIEKWWVFKFMRLVTRLGIFNTKCPPGVSYSDNTLSASAAVRLYQGQEEPSGAGVLWIHGGGLVHGTNKVDDKMCSRYVTELGAVVGSVDYRLAPEHPFPAAIDDCYEAWLWFVEQAPSLGMDRSKLIVAGQSGGGCLAASLCQHIYDKGGIQPVAQLLHCPMLDDRTAANQELDSIDHLFWNNVNNRVGWSSYLACEAGSDSVPENAVPARRQDFRGLPPAWMGIGDLDLFYDEAMAYMERLDECCIKTIVDIVPKAAHGFEIFAEDTELVTQYFARHFAAVRELITR